ncbi:OprO/OprP family phosphate-selective porin [Prevotella sp. AGR2160]|uniref:OprO/OprP family phosphate-selective porin n=1 Tax=Prevotella sp. AGR2160 TaxID=1280674 RepID=UPI0004081F63|nr:porin [Prevotella sp. AGR2160]
MNKSMLLLGSALLLAAPLFAQENSESKLVVKPSGRILLDAGLFDANKEINDKLNDGMAVPDARVGFKATYEDWTAKVDIGYAYGKVGLKDIFIEHSLGKQNLIRAGYFVHQYGLQSATSSSFKISMEEPRSNQALNNSRLLGLMFEHADDKFLGTFSFFSETDAMKMTSDKTGNQGIGVMTRLVYHPFTAPGRIFHVGLSGAYESPRYNSNSDLNHKSFVLSTTWPTRIAQVTSMSATVDNAKAMYKFTPEVTAAYDRIGFEGQYFYNAITREEGNHSFHSNGAYATVRGLLLGKQYKYNYWDGGIDTPARGSLELVLSYDYLDLSDSKAQVWGGRSNDWSATINYYINKYMIWRIRGSYTKVTDRAGYDDNHFSALETRLQIKF